MKNDLVTEHLFALRRSGLLDPPSKPAFDRLASLAARLLRARVGLVFLVDSDHQPFPSDIGRADSSANLLQAPLTESLCRQVIASGEPLLVEDARSDSLTRENPTREDLGAFAFLGLPLKGPSGFVVGSLCVIDGEPRAWSQENLATLSELAACVITEMTLHAEVAERARAVSQGRESEARFRHLYENVKDFSIFATDQDGVVTHWNSGAENIFGYREEEILGRTAALLFTPEDRAKGVPGRELESAARTGRSQDERWHQKKDGSRFFARGMVTPLTDESGVLIGFTRICRDLTSRIEADRERERLIAQADSDRRLLDAVFDALPVGLAYAEPGGRLVRMNRANHELWNDPPTTGSIAEYAQWVGYRAATGRRVEPNEWPLARILTTGEAVAAEHFQVERFHGGGWRDVLISGAPVRDADGRLAAGVIALVDVTDLVAVEAKLRESEEKFRTLFDSIDQGYTLLELIEDEAGLPTDLRYLETNRVFGRQTGVGEVVGRTVREVFPVSDPSWIEPYLRVAQTGEPARFERHVVSTGRWFNVFATRVGDVGTRRIAVVFDDITEKRLAQIEVQQMAATVAFSGDAIISKDIEGVITSWNAAAERLFGYAASEIVGRPITVLIPEELLGEEVEILGKIRRGERIENFETRRRTKAGRHIDVAITVSPIRNAEGAVIGASKVARDVTERKRIEEALRRSRERLDVALAASELVGTWDWDLTANVVASDERFARLFSVDPTMAEQGAPALEYTRSIHPDDIGRVEAAIARVLAGAETYSEEYRLIQPDGSIRWVVGRGRAQKDESGRSVRLPGVVIDITERKAAEEALRASEERYRLLAASVKQLFWSCTPSGDCDYLSRQWVDYTGIPEADQLGLQWLDLVIHPDDRARTLNVWMEAVQGRGAYDLEYRIKGADGLYRWFKTRGTPIHDESGNIAKWFGTCTDIDAQKSAEEAAVEARAEAEAANRAKDEFLATLSHELRTPLNAIVGWAKILKSGKCDADDVAEAVEVIDRNGQAQSRLIEDLLDVSRITTGNLRLDVQRLNVADVIEAAIAAVSPTAATKEIRLLKTLDSLVGPVSGDFARLQQVIWNLLTNAVKFTPRGGRVQILLERVNSHVEICVIDTGMGISPAFLPHVFDRFRQADASTTRRHGGLGLGLSIVKHLVEMHGGSIRAKSPGEGQGSTFTVSLPITVVHPERPEPAKTRPRENSSHDREDFCQDGALVGLKILVVDDEPDARQMIRRVLTDCRAEVVVAASAAEALECLERFGPDVIVSDVGMPGEDGYDLMRKVRETISAKQVPAIALTAFARPEDRKRAMLAGFQSHVAKPVDPAELTAVVASLAGRTG